MGKVQSVSVWAPVWLLGYYEEKDTIGGVEMHL